MKDCGCIPTSQKVTIPIEVERVAQNLADTDGKPYAIVLCSDWDISCVTVADLGQIYEIKLPRR